MYSGLGQAAPTLQRVNPDGSVTYYFGPIADVQQHFPTASEATVIPEPERQAILAEARATAAGNVVDRLPGWLVPVGGVLALFWLLRR